jgi:hypothetical protein
MRNDMPKNADKFADISKEEAIELLTQCWVSIDNLLLVEADKFWTPRERIIDKARRDSLKAKNFITKSKDGK